MTLYLDAYLLCFFELTFISILFMLLHSLREHIGLIPFYLAIGGLFIFSNFVNAAGISINFDPIGINVSTTILYMPFLSALLIVYVVNGTLSAQRLALACISLCATFFFLSHITSLQTQWPGFSTPEYNSRFFEQILNVSKHESAATLCAILTDFIVLPVTFQLLKNKKLSDFWAIIISFSATMVIDTFIISLTSASANITTMPFWEYTRFLYLTRISPVIWVGVLTAIYLKLTKQEHEEQEQRSAFDYIKAIVSTYSKSSVINKYSQEWDDRYKVFFNNSQDIILMVKENGLIMEANTTAANLFQYKRQEMQNMSISRLITPADQKNDKLPEAFLTHKEDNETWVATWGRLLKKWRNDKSLQHQWLMNDSQGQPLFTDWYSSVVEEGNAKIALLCGRDLSEKTLLEFDKENLVHQLAHSQRLEAIGRLAGGVAHDFNNLLHSIQGSLDNLDNQDSSRQQSLISNMNHAIDRAGNLTGQLLGFAQKGKFAPKKYDLGELVLNAFKLFEPTGRKKCKLRKAISPDPMIITADGTQIEQVILNLLINAADAMEHTEKAKVSLRAEVCGNFLLGWENAPMGAKTSDYFAIRIKDNGPGIPDDLKNQIFEPFFTTKDVGKGTGMGLAMAYGTITNHKGWIHLESGEGQGAEFTIFLPRANSATLNETQN